VEKKKRGGGKDKSLVSKKKKEKNQVLLAGPAEKGNRAGNSRGPDKDIVTRKRELGGRGGKKKKVKTRWLGETNQKKKTTKEEKEKKGKATGVGPGRPREKAREGGLVKQIRPPKGPARGGQGLEGKREESPLL